MPRAKKPSPAIQLLDHVWEHANGAVDHSWERLNHSMRDALTLAIGSGMRFAADDIQHVLANYDSSRWRGDSIEWVYALAIGVMNKSAIDSFEHAVGRTAFIADDVSFHSRTGFIHAGHVNRQRERLAVGFAFYYRGVKLVVTSFNDTRGVVTACSYKQTENGYRGEIDKRFTLTREHIIADRAERKKAEAAG